MTLALRQLQVHAGTRRLLGPLDLEVAPGRCLGVVGESGSGKSLSALSLLGLLPGGLWSSGEVLHEGRSIPLGPRIAPAHVALRGRVLGWVPQDPLASLHPLRTVGAQLRETLRVHGRPDREARDLLARVHLPDPGAALARFPHQFSGGQRQRIAIALALCSGPRYLIADEPTSALDARIAREVLDLLDVLRREDGLGLMLISHDLPLVGAYADEVLVLQRGDVVERGATRAVFDAPAQDYTRELIEAEQIPPSPLRDAAPLLQRGRTAASSLSSEGLRVDAAVAVASSPLAVPSDAVMPSEAAMSPLCKRGRAAAQQSTGDLPLLRGEALTMRYPRAATPALDNVDIALHRGEGLALLGESGSGKSTLGRVLLRLLRGAQGRVWLDGVDFTAQRGATLRALRGRIGVVFQDPYASLDPRMRVGDIVGEPLRIHGDGDAASRAAKARELLAAVGLDPAMAERWPHQFSGGQRQRIAIARALARDPDLLVCDEAVSALDAHHRRGILDLLSSLKRERGLALLFVTHDLSAAAAVAERIAVLEAGRIVELGDTPDVLGAPQHAHTRALVEARKLQRA
ncbi:ATP-binding cassette domain-containing protein [Lysobacter brunescens]|uniref:ATP-binding cassette domain-containing protein n=1 Tax=Lysobacter brunescens TaxID=262323 RepID=A0ABW2Y8Y5_9GAMM